MAHKSIDIYAWIKVEMGSEVENIVHRPSTIYHQTRFTHEVTAMNDIPDRDHCSISAVWASRLCDDIHTSDVVRLNQGGEPFNICQQVWKGSKMGG